MKILNLSNLVILTDGVRNNHEIQLTTVMDKRVPKVLEIDSRYVFFLKKARALWRGKLIFEEPLVNFFWFAVCAEGDFAKEVNSKTVESVIVSAIRTRLPLEKEIYLDYKKRVMRILGIQHNSLTFRILEMYSQDEMAKKSAPAREVTQWEMLCYQARNLLTLRK